MYSIENHLSASHSLYPGTGSSHTSSLFGVNGPVSSEQNFVSCNGSFEMTFPIPGSEPAREKEERVSNKVTTMPKYGKKRRVEDSRNEIMEDDTRMRGTTTTTGREREAAAGERNLESKAVAFKNIASDYDMGFVTFPLNDINLGTSNYQRDKQSVYLKYLRYTVRVSCVGLDQGTVLRYGVFYDKNCGGTDTYFSTHLFRSLLDTSDPDSLSNALSPRNTEYMDRIIMVLDETICFSHNKTFFDLTSSSIKIEQEVPGPYLRESAVNLQPLVTVFDKNGEQGTQKNKVNGNLCIFFFPYITSTSKNYNKDTRFQIQYNTRLCYSTSRDFTNICNDKTLYLSNPNLFHMTDLLDKAVKESSNKSVSPYDLSRLRFLFNSTSSLSPEHQLDLFTDAFMILNSPSKSMHHYSISAKKTNGLCYLRSNEISEISYVDYYSTDNKIIYYNEHKNSENQLVFIINRMKNLF